MPALSRIPHSSNSSHSPPSIASSVDRRTFVSLPVMPTTGARQRRHSTPRSSAAVVARISLLAQLVRRMADLEAQGHARSDLRRKNSLGSVRSSKRGLNPNLRRLAVKASSRTDTAISQKLLASTEQAREALERIRVESSKRRETKAEERLAMVTKAKAAVDLECQRLTNELETCRERIISLESKNTALVRENEELRASRQLSLSRGELRSRLQGQGHHPSLSQSPPESSNNRRQARPHRSLDSISHSLVQIHGMTPIPQSPSPSSSGRTPSLLASLVPRIIVHPQPTEIFVTELEGHPLSPTLSSRSSMSRLTPQHPSLHRSHSSSEFNSQLVSTPTAESSTPPRPQRSVRRTVSFSSDLPSSITDSWTFPSSPSSSRATVGVTVGRSILRASTIDIPPQPRITAGGSALLNPWTNDLKASKTAIDTSASSGEDAYKISMSLQSPITATATTSGTGAGAGSNPPPPPPRSPRRGLPAGLSSSPPPPSSDVLEVESPLSMNANDFGALPTPPSTTTMKDRRGPIPNVDQPSQSQTKALVQSLSLATQSRAKSREEQAKALVEGWRVGVPSGVEAVGGKSSSLDL